MWVSPKICYNQAHTKPLFRIHLLDVQDVGTNLIVNFVYLTVYVFKATITQCDLSATILFKFVDPHLIVFTFAK